MNMRTDSDRKALEDYLALQRDAERLLGQRAWSLVRSYGKVMSGPDAGQYVSGIATVKARKLVVALAKGKRVNVHLMHRHQSGNYRVSSLVLQDGRLLMIYTDGNVETA